MNRNYRTLGAVPRWSILRLVRPQTVLEHTALVALYASDICQLCELDDYTPEAVVLALRHDLPEVEMGDLPSPVKRRISNPETIELYEDEIFERRFNMGHPFSDTAHDVVKVADLLEAVLKLTEELAAGNRSVEKVLHGLTAMLRDKVSRLPYPERLWDAIQDAISDEYHGCDGIGHPKESAGRVLFEDAKDKNPR